MAWILPQVELWLRLLDLGPLSHGVTGYGPNHLFYKDVLLHLDKDIPHLGDVVLHQMFVEGVCDLQPIDEYGSGYVLVIVIYQGHLALKLFDVVLQTLPRFHLYHKEVVVVPMKFPLRSKLVVEYVGRIMEVPE